MQTKVSKANGPSELSGRTRIHKLEEQALRNYWTIETNRGGRRTAIPRMESPDGSYDGRSENTKKNCMQ